MRVLQMYVGGPSQRRKSVGWKLAEPSFPVFVRLRVRCEFGPCLTEQERRVTQFPETQESLLLQVRDPQDAAAWARFSQIYRPVVYRLARQRGLQDADAQDLSQQVLMSVASAIGRWEDRGEHVRFRHWLRRVARNAIINALTRRPKIEAVGGTSVSELLSEQPHPDDAICQQVDLEYRRELYLQAAERIRVDVQPETWLAFQRSVIDGICIEETAREIGKSTGTVYAARSRIMRRLREAVQEAEAQL